MGRRVLPARLRKGRPCTDPTFKRLVAASTSEELESAFTASTDERAKHLANLMNSPAHRGKSLAALALLANISYAELLRILTNHRLGEGIMRMSGHVGDVLEDTAIDAKSKMVPCPSCKGAGTIERVEGEGDDATVEHETCWSCDGVGKLRKPGDADARKAVFETFGLTNKGKPLVNVNVSGGGINTVEDDIGGAARILELPAKSTAE